MKFTCVVFCFLLITGIKCKSVAKGEQNNVDGSDRFGSFESFLKTKVTVPQISHGSSGTVHKVSKHTTVEREKDHKLTMLLNQIYSQFIGDNDNTLSRKDIDDNNVSAHPTTVKPSGNVNFGDIVKVVDRLIKEMGLEDGNIRNKANQINEDTESLKKFSNSLHLVKTKKDEVERTGSNKKPVPTFEKFKEKFFKTFLRSDIEQRIVYNGKKDDSMDAHVNKQSISDVYDELKKETQEEKRRTNVHTKTDKDSEIEKKKRELISLLNEITDGKNRILYDGKHAVLASDVKKDERVESNNGASSVSSDGQDYEKLYKQSGNRAAVDRSMEDVFLDTFKQEFEKRIAEKDEQKRKVDTERFDHRKEVLKKYLSDYIRKLDTSVTKKDDVKRHDDSSDDRKKTSERYASELEDISSNKKLRTKQYDKELAKALQGFKFAKRDASNQKDVNTGRP